MSEPMTVFDAEAKAKRDAARAMDAAMTREDEARAQRAAASDVSTSDDDSATAVAEEILAAVSTEEEPPAPDAVAQRFRWQSETHRSEWPDYDRLAKLPIHTEEMRALIADHPHGAAIAYILGDAWESGDLAKVARVDELAELDGAALARAIDHLGHDAPAMADLVRQRRLAAAGRSDQQDTDEWFEAERRRKLERVLSGRHF